MSYAPPLAETLAASSRAIARVLNGESLSEALPAGRQPGVQDVVYGTLRDYGVADVILARLLRRPATDVGVHALLLCALRELRRDRAAAYTVVDQAVSACVALGFGTAKGLVNAVLRNYLRRRDELERHAIAGEVGRFCHPQWWIDRLRESYPDSWQSVLEAGNTHPPMTLRINRRRVERDVYLQRLQAAGIDADAIGMSGVRLARPMPVADVPGFAAGEVSVQDAAAQYTAPLLALADGLSVLDACAAPGGKAGQILETADVRLVALDRDRARAQRIEQNLARLDLVADVHVADAKDVDAWWDGACFDRILLDAPCTGSGVVRRHPDIKWLRRESDIASFAVQQRQLLDALWRVLARDGKFLYATCSVFPEENRLQITDFLTRHPDARLLPALLPRDGQLLPDSEHDGFYYALLEKARG